MLGEYINTKNRITGWISVSIVFIFWNAIGFPGSYEFAFGHTFEMLVEYTSFILQIAIMLMTSANDFMDIKLIDTKPKYNSIYEFLTVVFIGSLIASNYKGEELISVIRVVVTANFALWLCDNLSIKEILTKLYYAQILYVLASIAFPVFFKAYDYRGASYRDVFVGIGGTKNVTAAELSFGIIMMVVLWRLKQRDKEAVSMLFMAMLIVQGILLLMTKGTGALLITIFTVVAVIYSDKTNRRYSLGNIYVAGTLLFLVIALTMMPLFEPILDALGKDATLTGRIPLWRQLIEVMQSNRPFTGYGYGMFWRDSESVSLMHAGFANNSWAANMTSGAHNNLLELWANDGLIGVISFFAMILAAFRKTNSISKDRYLYCFAFMTYFMINGWTERLWTTFEYGILFMFLAAGLACCETTQTASILNDANNSLWLTRKNYLEQ